MNTYIDKIAEKKRPRRQSIHERPSWLENLRDWEDSDTELEPPLRRSRRIALRRGRSSNSEEAGTSSSLRRSLNQQQQNQNSNQNQSSPQQNQQPQSSQQDRPSRAQVEIEFAPDSSDEERAGRQIEVLDSLQDLEERVLDASIDSIIISHRDNDDIIYVPQVSGLRSSLQNLQRIRSNRRDAATNFSPPPSPPAQDNENNENALPEEPDASSRLPQTVEMLDQDQPSTSNSNSNSSTSSSQSSGIRSRRRPFH